MFKKSILISFLFIIVLIGSVFVAQAGAKKDIILTVMTKAHPYFQSVITEWEEIAAEEGFNLTVMDPNMKTSEQMRIIEDAITKNPDGIAFAPINSKIAVKMLQKIKKAQIPVVAYNINPDKKIVPTVVGGNYQGGFKAGKTAAKKWKETHPDEEPVIGIIGQVGIPAVTARENGFADGFKEVYPSIEVKQTVNGKGVRNKALKAAEDLLSAHHDINILFGINDSSALGALDALKEINRDTPEEALVAGIDGSVPALKELTDPESAYQVEIGNPPADMARKTYNLLEKVITGKVNEYKEVKVPFLLIEPDETDKWLDKQYPQKERF